MDKECSRLDAKKGRRYASQTFWHAGGRNATQLPSVEASPTASLTSQATSTASRCGGRRGGETGQAGGGGRFRVSLSQSLQSHICLPPGFPTGLVLRPVPRASTLWSAPYQPRMLQVL